MSINCPLCGSQDPIPSGNVPRNLIEIYWKSINVDISHLIDADSSGFEIFRCFECDLKFFDPLVSGDAGLYEEISKQASYYNPHKWEFDLILDHLYKSKNIHSLLEVGSGAGFFLEKAVKFIEDVEGVELNPKGIELARAKGLSVSNTDLFDVTKTYDAIVSFQVLEHVEKPGKMIEKMIDRLNPGGKLVIVVPNQDGILGELQYNFLNMPPHHLTLWSQKSMAYIAQNFDVKMLEYITEPLSIEMYVAFRDDHIRRLQQSSGILNRISNKIRNVIMDAHVVSDFVSSRDKLAGHSHIAIYQKSL